MKHDNDLLFRRAKSVPILDVLNYYGIQLRGSKICCPWHEDSTPSAHIYTETNVGYCFGCVRGQFDSISIVMLKENLDFYNAMVFLNNNFVVSDNYVSRQKKNLEFYFKINDEIRQCIKQGEDIEIIRYYSQLIDMNNENVKVIKRLYGTMIKQLDKGKLDESKRDDSKSKI